MYKMLIFVLTAIIALSAFEHTEGLSSDIGLDQLIAAGEVFATYVRRLEDKSTGCQCEGNKCSCCIDLDVETLRLDVSACLVVTYLPKEDEISAALEWNEETVLEKTVSLRNPSPLCVRVPKLRILKVCVGINDVAIEDGDVHMCFNFQFKLTTMTVLTKELGCVDI